MASRKVYFIFDDESVYTRQLVEWNSGHIRNLIKHTKLLKTKTTEAHSNMKNFLKQKKDFIENAPERVKNGSIVIGFEISHFLNLPFFQTLTKA